VHRPGWIPDTVINLGLERPGAGVFPFCVVLLEQKQTCSVPAPPYQAFAGVIGVSRPLIRRHAMVWSHCGMYIGVRAGDCVFLELVGSREVRGRIYNDLDVKLPVGIEVNAAFGRILILLSRNIQLYTL
jgi:hypothetical protein